VPFFCPILFGLKIYGMFMRSRRMLKIDVFMRKGNKKVHYLVVALACYPNL
jgi:hypothetical protein